MVSPAGCKGNLLLVGTGLEKLVRCGNGSMATLFDTLVAGAARPSRKQHRALSTAWQLIAAAEVEVLIVLICQVMAPARKVDGRKMPMLDGQLSSALTLNILCVHSGDAKRLPR